MQGREVCDPPVMDFFTFRQYLNSSTRPKMGGWSLPVLNLPCNRPEHARVRRLKGWGGYTGGPPARVVPVVDPIIKTVLPLLNEGRASKPQGKIARSMNVLIARSRPSGTETSQISCLNCLSTLRGAGTGSAKLVFDVVLIST